jgi:hypothetical protein
MNLRRVLQTTAIVILAAGAVSVLGTLLVRDQISRSRRDLFSPQPLRRLAALRYLGNAEASVDLVRLLRDFIAWEPRPILKRQAVHVLERMERTLAKTPTAEGVAG